MDANIKQMGNLWDSAEYMFMSPIRNTSFTMFVLFQQILHYRFKMRLMSWTRLNRGDTVLSVEPRWVLLWETLHILLSFYSILLAWENTKDLFLEKSQIKALFSGAKRFLEKSICSISFSICACCILQSFALQVNWMWCSSTLGHSSLHEIHLIVGYRVQIQVSLFVIKRNLRSIFIPHHEIQVLTTKDNQSI